LSLIAEARRALAAGSPATARLVATWMGVKAHNSDAANPFDPQAEPMLAETFARAQQLGPAGTPVPGWTPIPRFQSTPSVAGRNTEEAIPSRIRLSP